MASKGFARLNRTYTVQLGQEAERSLMILEAVMEKMPRAWNGSRLQKRTKTGVFQLALRCLESIAGQGLLAAAEEGRINWSSLTARVK